MGVCAACLEGGLLTERPEICSRGASMDWQEARAACLFKNITIWDFPGGSMVRSPLSNTGNAGLILAWGTEIPHAVG